MTFVFSLIAAIFIVSFIIAGVDSIIFQRKLQKRNEEIYGPEYEPSSLEDSGEEELEK